MRRRRRRRWEGAGRGPVLEWEVARGGGSRARRGSRRGCTTRASRARARRRGHTTPSRRRRVRAAGACRPWPASQPASEADPGSHGRPQHDRPPGGPDDHPARAHLAKQHLHPDPVPATWVGRGHPRLVARRSLGEHRRETHQRIDLATVVVDPGADGEERQGMGWIWEGRVVAAMASHRGGAGRGVGFRVHREVPS